MCCKADGWDGMGGGWGGGGGCNVLVPLAKRTDPAVVGVVAWFTSMIVLLLRAAAASSSDSSAAAVEEEGGGGGWLGAASSPVMVCPFLSPGYLWVEWAAWGKGGREISVWWGAVCGSVNLACLSVGWGEGPGLDIAVSRGVRRQEAPTPNGFGLFFGGGGGGRLVRRHSASSLPLRGACMARGGPGPGGVFFFAMMNEARSKPSYVQERKGNLWMCVRQGIRARAFLI